MLFDFGFQSAFCDPADSSCCDLMLFDFGFQSVHSWRHTAASCDLILFDFGFQFKPKLTTDDC